MKITSPIANGGIDEPSESVDTYKTRPLAMIVTANSKATSA